MAGARRATSAVTLGASEARQARGQRIAAGRALVSAGKQPAEVASMLGIGVEQLQEFRHRNCGYRRQVTDSAPIRNVLS